MNELKVLKTQASLLKAALLKQGIALTRGQSLEAIAGQYGYDTWDALCGVVKSIPLRTKLFHEGLTLASVDFIPDNVRYESGPYTRTYTVGHWDTEGIALASEPAALAEYLESIGESLTSAAITLWGNGHDVHLSYEDVASATMSVLAGTPTWCLKEKDAYMVVYGYSLPELPPVLVVPKMATK